MARVLSTLRCSQGMFGGDIMIRTLDALELCLFAWSGRAHEAFPFEA